MATDTEYEQTLDGEIIEVDAGGSLALVESLERAQVDIQITTAKKFPRSLVAFKRQALEFATLDEETAASMFYVLPRAGKKIEGPSVRLAEVVGSCWGNLRYGARIVATDAKFVTAQGFCFDLEKNISAAVEVKRRITDKYGKTYKDDMIQVTSNAACAVALRQAIFKVVPFAFVKGIYDQAKLTSIGKAESMAERREKMLGWFTKLGVSESQVLGSIERKGVDEITIDDLITLRGMATAIKDGETTIEEAFQATGKSGPKVGTSDLTEKLKGTQKPAETPPEPTTEPDNADSFADIIATVEGKLRDCKTKTEIRTIHMTYVGHNSPWDDEQQKAITELCDKRADEIGGARGEKANQKGLLGE